MGGEKGTVSKGERERRDARSNRRGSRGEGKYLSSESLLSVEREGYTGAGFLSFPLNYLCNGNA